MNGDSMRLTAALESRYTIEREIGAGGMATVFLAHDVRHDRKVALKVLKPELAAVMGADRFLSEIRTTANLQHPHILPLFDSGEADGFLYFVMPYVEGESLRERLDREGELPVSEAVRIAAAVASALDYAHRQGVIHRDIKPANILLHDGEPLVADFGIALAVSVAGGGRLTETGLSLGTPYYMSPEQATAERDPDARSDIYSLGCVLYEMLTGEPPFTGGSAQAVLGKILTTEPVRPTEHRRAIPAHIDAVILTALEKRPADRFGTAADMAAALGDASFHRRGARGVRPAPLASPRVTAALAGALAIATALAAWGWLRPVANQARAVRYTIDVPSGHLMQGGEGSRLAIADDGSAVAWVANDGYLWVRGLDTFESRRLDGTGGAENPFFSPGGQWVGFSRDGGLSRIAIDGGPVIGIPGVTGTAFDAGVHWHPSGVIIYTPFAGADGVWSVPAEGGTATRIVARGPDENHTIWPQLLDDGRFVLYTATAPSGTFRDVRTMLVDVNTGERTVVAEGGTYARYVPTGHVIFTDAAGTVFARPVDLKSRSASGPAFPVQSGVRVSWWGGGAASLQISANGAAAFVEGSTDALFRMTWIDRQGRVAGYVGEPLTSGEPRISPDGTQVVTWISDPDNADLWLIELATGIRTRLTNAPHWEWMGAWSPDGRRIAHQGQNGEPQAVFVRDAAPGGPSTPVVDSPTEVWVESCPPGRAVAADPGRRPAVCAGPSWKLVSTA